MSAANLESVSRGGGTIHPLLSLPGPEGGNSARGDLSCAEEAKTRAVGTAVPSTMHRLACIIFQFK